MRAELTDGRDFDFTDSRIVFVAKMTTPKGAVLSRIADTAPQDVRIVVREPLSLGRLWAESAEQTLDPRLVQLNGYRHTKAGEVDRVTDP